MILGARHIYKTLTLVCNSDSVAEAAGATLHKLGPTSYVHEV